MSFPNQVLMRLLIPWSRLAPLAVLTLWGSAMGSVLSAADATVAPGPAPTAPSSRWNLAEFIDSLPDLLSERLPGFDPDGVVRLYVRPHFGDFLHRDYLRVPFGAKVRVAENIESSGELQTYFTHGLGDSAGYGISGLRLGTKCDHAFPSINDGAGLSVGFTYETPLSRPPIDLTDGHRHFQPYVSGTRPLVPEWKLLGFASVGADLLDRTALPAHFGRNQLHSNSLIFVAGAAREWSRFRASLTTSVTTASLISDEGKNVYAIRPEVVFPWKTKALSRTRFLFTVGARSVWGPDGHELGLSSSMRVEFLFHRQRSTPK